MELGWLGTLIDVLRLLFESVMTSIRLLVKSATYRTPRGSSSARSDASPPMGITFPNVPALPADAARTIAVARIQVLPILSLRNIALKLHPPAGPFKTIRLSSITSLQFTALIHRNV